MILRPDIKSEQSIKKKKKGMGVMMNTLDKGKRKENSMSLHRPNPKCFADTGQI